MNPHVLRQWILSPPRLPVPPSGQNLQAISSACEGYNGVPGGNRTRKNRCLRPARLPKIAPPGHMRLQTLIGRLQGLWCSWWESNPQSIAGIGSLGRRVCHFHHRNILRQIFVPIRRRKYGGAGEARTHAPCV